MQGAGKVTLLFLSQKTCWQWRGELLGVVALGKADSWEGSGLVEGGCCYTGLHWRNLERNW